MQVILDLSLNNERLEVSLSNPPEPPCMLMDLLVSILQPLYGQGYCLQVLPEKKCQEAPKALLLCTCYHCACHIFSRLRRQFAILICTSRAEGEWEVEAARAGLAESCKGLRAAT